MQIRGVITRWFSWLFLVAGAGPLGAEPSCALGQVQLPTVNLGLTGLEAPKGDLWLNGDAGISYSPSPCFFLPTHILSAKISCVAPSDSNSEWPDKMGTAKFEALPAFYQSLWFRSLCLITLLLALAGLYQLRLRRLARQYDIRIEERVGERTRIARDLHDTLLQSFQALLLRYQVAYELLPARPTEAKHDLALAIDRTVHALNEGRTAVQGLRAVAVDDCDLIDAIKTLIEEMAEDKTAFRVILQGTVRLLRPLARDEIYHIAGEALHNARRHAQASEVEVELCYHHTELRLRVRDNGGGIEPRCLRDRSAPRHYGLVGMRERAKLLGGLLHIWTAPKLGTEIELRVPAARAYAAKRAGRFRGVLKRLLPIRGDE